MAGLGISVFRAGDFRTAPKYYFTFSRMPIFKSGLSFGMRRGGRLRSRPHVWAVVAFGFTATAAAYAQLSPAAYRVLGQADLRQDGANAVQGIELNSPFAI